MIKSDDIYTIDNRLVTQIRSQNENCFLTCINLSFLKPKSNEYETSARCLLFLLTIYVMNFQYVQLSHYVLMIVAQDDRKMILQT